MNVIVVLMDTLRRDYLGAYGNTWVKTPALDAFAQRATQFMNSYMASYPCMPARQDLWTGRCNFFWRGWSPMEYTDRDLVRVMREQGHITQMITDHYHYWQWGGGNYHMNFDGVEMIRGQEGDNWITDSTMQVEYPAPPERLRAGYDIYYKNTAHFQSEEDFFGPSVFRAATRWVERNYDRPFFLMIDSFDPHEPWHTPDEYWRMYDPDYKGDHLVWPPYGKADRFDQKELHHIRSCYAGEITLSDKYFGQLMERLERLDLLKNTMVVITADHGYLFGEHNWVGKHSSTLYNHIAQTPLLIYHPHQAQPGRQVHHLVQMPDLYATILDAVGADVGDVHGRSLLPFLLDGGPGEPIHEVACFGMHGEQLHVTDGEWVYVRRPQKAGPLYWYTSSHFFDATWPGSAKPYRYMDLESTRRRGAQFDGQRFPVGEDNPAFVPAPDELYHLPTDAEQNRNLAAERPDVCERLRAAAGRYMRQIGVPAEQFERLGINGGDPYRPGYHFAAPAGWINDPNGLIQWKGQYHLFYQHHPYSTEWGPMHWGHAVSPDLVHWTHLPVALAPEHMAQKNDQTGIFSGSAVDDNGILTLIYTLSTDLRCHPDSTREVQCVATSTDGIRFDKYPGNPVIAAPPAEATAGFRDPKVWRDVDGLWKMVVGSGHEGRGKAQLYASDTLRQWTYLGPLCEGDGTSGAMWECPDLFPLGDRHVLIFSVNEPPMKPATYYFVGTYANNRFTPERHGDTDFGPDFYAAQTFADCQGRRVMIGWMDRWGAEMPSREYGWAGTMSLPRELFLLPDGRLGVRPVAEAERLRTASLGRWEQVELSPNGENLLSALRGDTLEILAEFDLAEVTAAEFGLQVLRSPDGLQRTTVSYSPEAGVLTLDRNAAGLGDGGVYAFSVAPGRSVLKLRLFVDRCSVEAFVNDGEAAGSAKVYPASKEGLDLALFASGGQVQVKSIEVWQLGAGGSPDLRPAAPGPGSAAKKLGIAPAE